MKNRIVYYSKKTAKKNPQMVVDAYNKILMQKRSLYDKLIKDFNLRTFNVTIENVNIDDLKISNQIKVKIQLKNFTISSFDMSVPYYGGYQPFVPRETEQKFNGIIAMKRLKDTIEAFEKEKKRIEEEIEEIIKEKNNFENKYVRKQNY